MSQKQLFTNFAAGLLAAPITNVATTITLGSGQGAIFPALSGAQFFIGTLKNVGTGYLEIIKVTIRATDTLTVIRGQEGTTPAAFSTGDVFELRNTSQAYNNLYAESAQLDGATFTGAVALNGGATSTTPSLVDNTTKVATTAYVQGQAYAPLASPTLTGIPTAPTAAPSTNTTQIATTAFVTTATIPTLPITIRQAIQFGPTTGTPAISALIPISQIGNTLATGVTLKHSTAPTLYSVANGYLTSGAANNLNWRTTVDLTVSNLTASSTNYIWVDTISQTAGFVIVADSDQNGGTIPVTNNQYTFDYSGMINYLGNGTTASQTNRIIVAEVDTNGTAVTAVRCRAYKREFEGTFVTPLPSANTLFIQNSNLGTANKVFSYVELECLTAEFGYVVGQRIIGVVGFNGVYGNAPTILNSKNTTSTQTGSSNAWMVIQMTNGSSSFLTIANWKGRFVAQSNWGRS